jgi:hypothetical protein
MRKGEFYDELAEVDRLLTGGKIRPQCTVKELETAHMLGIPLTPKQKERMRQAQLPSNDDGIY